MKNIVGFNLLFLFALGVQDAQAMFKYSKEIVKTSALGGTVVGLGVSSYQYSKGKLEAKRIPVATASGAILGATGATVALAGTVVAGLSGAIHTMNKSEEIIAGRLLTYAKSHERGSITPLGESRGDSSQGVAVVIDFIGNYGTQGIQEKVEQELKKSYPNKQIKFVNASNPGSLRTGLSHILGEGETISHLFIRGHGASPDRTSSVIQFSAEPNRFLLFGEQLDQGKAPANSSFLLAKDFFAPMNGRFTNDSKIYLFSCDLVRGDKATAKKKIDTIANALDMKGEVFAASQSLTCLRGDVDSLHKSNKNEASYLAAASSGLVLAAKRTTSSLPKRGFQVAALAASAKAITKLSEVSTGVLRIKRDPNINWGYKARVRDGKTISMIPAYKDEFEDIFFGSKTMGNQVAAAIARREVIRSDQSGALSIKHPMCSRSKTGPMSEDQGGLIGTIITEIGKVSSEASKK